MFTWQTHNYQGVDTHPFSGNVAFLQNTHRVDARQNKCFSWPFLPSNACLEMGDCVLNT